MTKKRRQSKKKTSVKFNKNKIFTFLIKTGIVIILFMLFLFGCVYFGFFGKIPTIIELQHIQHYLASEIYSNENILLGRYYYQNRTKAGLENIPEHFVDALIATEDVRFYHHNGIDQRSVLRVIFKTILLQKENAGGGSTIHQQLVKNLYPRKDYFILTIPVNKFREMIVGVRLNKVYTKNEILELYLNTVSFGENTYGIGTASKRFFNKSPKDLTVEESAVLVGMLKATSYYNPKLQPDKALKRRNTVLSQMVKYGYLKEKECDSLKGLPVKLNYIKYTHNEGPAPYFREQLRLRLLKWFDEHPKDDGTRYNIYTDGLKIYTTINADLQAYAENVVNQRMKRLQQIFDGQWKGRNPWGGSNDLVMNILERTAVYGELNKKGMNRSEIVAKLSTPHAMDVFTWDGMKRVDYSTMDSVIHYLKFLHAGLVSMEVNTGYIRAWVGGINHKYFKYDHVTSKRQAGSTFKPIVYAAALESGIEPCDYIPNDSVAYKDYNNWVPRNADGKYGGFYSMKGGLTHSVNTISVHLLDEVGIDKVISLAEKMGIEERMPHVLSLGLGTAEVSLLELMEVYSVFVNKGRKVEPVLVKKIEDRHGNVILENTPRLSGPVISPENADLMLGMLKGVVNQGTASSLRSTYGFQCEIAGKTGTTQHNTDGWFIGCTPVLITGVWVGGDHPVVRFRYGNIGQGASSALPIWARYMQKIYANPVFRYSKNQHFEIGDTILSKLDCKDYVQQTDEDRLFELDGERGFEILRRIIRKLNPLKKEEKYQDNDN